MSNIEHVLTWLTGGGLIAIASAIAYVWKQIKSSNDKADIQIKELKQANKTFEEQLKVSQERHTACEEDRKEMRKEMKTLLEHFKTPNEHVVYVDREVPTIDGIRICNMPKNE